MKAYKNFHQSEVNYAEIHPTLKKMSANVMDQMFNYSEEPTLVLALDAEAIVLDKFV